MATMLQQLLISQGFQETAAVTSAEYAGSGQNSYLDVLTVHSSLHIWLGVI